MAHKLHRPTILEELLTNIQIYPVSYTHLDVYKRQHFDNSALQVVRSVSQTGRLVNQGLTDVSVLEGRRGLNVEPFLSGEWVDDLLLHTLLTLG